MQLVYFTTVLNVGCNPSKTLSLNAINVKLQHKNLKLKPTGKQKITQLRC